MKTILTLAAMRIRITLRNKAFLFFSLVMPMTFFFLYGSVLAKGEIPKVRYLLGPVIAMSVMGTFWGLSAQIVTWREQGILRRFRLAPIPASSMIGSSVLANMLLILPTVILELALARFVYHLKDFGNLGGIIVMSLIGIGAFASLGLIVASVTNTMQETQIINQLLWFALIFMSGATVPLPVLPHAAQRVALFSAGDVSGDRAATGDGAPRFAVCRCEQTSVRWSPGPRWRLRSLPCFSGGSRRRNCREMRSCGRPRPCCRFCFWEFGRITTGSC